MHVTKQESQNTKEVSFFGSPCIKCGQVKNKTKTFFAGA